MTLSDRYHICDDDLEELIGTEARKAAATERAIGECQERQARVTMFDSLAHVMAIQEWQFVPPDGRLRRERRRTN